MNLLLTMMFSSNILFLSYLAANALFGDELSARWKSCVLKLSVLLSLIPAAFIKPVMESVMWKSFAASDSLGFTTSGQEQLLLTGSEGIRLTPSLQTELVIFTVWFSIGLLSLFVHVFRYLAQKKAAMTSMCRIDDPAISEILMQIKNELKIKRTVQLYTCSLTISPFSMGLLRPIILLPCDMEPEKARLVIHHELCHIKHYDNLFTFLRLLTVSLFWFNPLFYLLNQKMEQLSELACDEVVIHTLSTAEKKAYGSLIIEIASTYSANPNTYVMAFCSHNEHRNNKEFKERITHIMNKKKMTKRSKNLSIILTLFMVLFSSFPSFAYQGPRKYDFCDESGAPIAIAPDETVVFVLEGTPNPFVKEASILYDYQFTDSLGNIYNLNDSSNLAPRANCQHTYVSGQTSTHQKKSDGSCVLKIYSAKRCSKCGNTVRGSLISTNTYNPCPH